MKKLTKIWMIAGAIVGVSLSSCKKEFNPKSYAPALSIDGYTSTKQVAASSLVNYWAFNGSLTDSVTNTTGTATGTSFTTGEVGSALQGANNGYVLYNTPADIQHLTSFTVTSWVKTPQNTNGIVGILDVANSTSFWGNLTIFFENGGTATSGNLKIHLNNNGLDGWFGSYAIASPWDKWINIAVSYDETSSTLKAYVNGSVVGTGTQAGYGALHFQNASQMVFGTVQFQTSPSLTSATTSQPWASYLTGQLDEVRIYNKALSDTEVSTIVKLQGRGK
jgi:hypothetical protein